MHKRKIEKALDAAVATAICEIGPGCIGKAPDIFKSSFRGESALIVADDNTMESAGNRIVSLFESSAIKITDKLIFPGRPILHADYEYVEMLKKKLEEENSIAVAVGSGTINDIAKLASHEIGRRYMVVGTAASVDGYTSYGAAILKNGNKLSIECKAPFAIIADTDILRLAPPAMTSAGYADLASKIPAGADWIIADILGIESINHAIWSMIQDDLRNWLADPKELINGNPEMFENLFEGLTMSGFAMQAYNDSRPASGADHFFSHIWEMENLEKDGNAVSHGFKVGIGTLASTAMMEILFAMDAEELKIDRAFDKLAEPEERMQEVLSAFAGNPVAEQFASISVAKLLCGDDLQKRLTLAKSKWPEMRSKLKKQLIPYPILKQMLRDANCPVTPAEINLTRERVRETCFKAQMIRKRYTVLDLAYDFGLLEECVDRIFSADTYF